MSKPQKNDVTTSFHAKYWAHALTLRGATGSIEALSRSIAGSRVDLNPHQVDAALFAIRSPLTRGVILADEVGLGKTIEAGIVISQRWAERKRRILVIVPATLRKQWQQEMETKFYLSTRVLDSRAFNALSEEGISNPFDSPDRLVICSYHFASAKGNEVHRVPWDLVVIDEAHRLRNVYKKASKLARNIADAVGSSPKLLLTATPLQNSLMELYGLASVIDDHLFGDAASFRDRFVRATDERGRNADLRARLQPICARTLRKQVVEYIPFTRRIAITQDFLPSDAEHELYVAISDYLQRDQLIALPASQRTLITLVLRKLLASSTFAIAATLERLAMRLEAMSTSPEILLDDEDLEGVDELQDELEEEEEAEESEEESEEEKSAEAPQRIDPERLKAEIADLRRFVERAKRISVNAKGEVLIPALKIAFDKAQELGAQRKAVLFTESRRTQEYLFDLLSRRGYEGKLVMMNGSNNDPQSKAIYETWRARQEKKDGLTGSRAVDMKAAIIEHFRDHATILIATEAAAEGVNLQFSSLVVNYDLPWNPQRIEQRIGRCHRYGQKHDVVVVNFLNRRNEADQRVFEILSEKFRLFDGVFGSSDEVLGALESGVDIERRIAQVYQTCRNTDEIKAAFDRLQTELDEQIQARMAQTRQTLLENFDEDVSARLRVHRDRTLESLGERERWLLELTRTELDGHARCEPTRPRFQYTGPHAREGWYHFDWREAERNGDTFYRQDHPLASYVIQQAIARELPTAALRLDYAGHGQVVSILKPYVGASGWLELSKLTVESLDVEEFLIFAARAADGRALDDETCVKLMLLPASEEGPAKEAVPDLSAIREAEVKTRLKQVEERNGRFFDEEVLKLDGWSDDLKQGLEREIKDLDRQIREFRKTSALAAALKDKLEAQKALKSLESERNRKRRELFDAQDAIDAQRDELIGRIEKQLRQRHTVKPLFAFRWRLA
jgi:adenine-specific DNA-methyltransferase